MTHRIKAPDTDTCNVCSGSGCEECNDTGRIVLTDLEKLAWIEDHQTDRQMERKFERTLKRRNQ